MIVTLAKVADFCGPGNAADVRPQRIESTLASCAAFGFPDWIGDQKDTIGSFGLTLEARDLAREGFDAVIDYG